MSGAQVTQAAFNGLLLPSFQAFLPAPRFSFTCALVLDDAQKISQKHDNGHLANGRDVYRCLFFDLRAKILLEGQS